MESEYGQYTAFSFCIFAREEFDRISLANRVGFINPNFIGQKKVSVVNIPLPKTKIIDADVITAKPQLLIAEDLHLSRLSYQHFLTEVFKLSPE